MTKMQKTCSRCLELRNYPGDFCYITEGGDQLSKALRAKRPKRSCRFCIDQHIGHGQAQRFCMIRKRYGLDLEALCAMWRAQGKVCVYCGKPLDLRLPYNFEVDHIKPVKQGGKGSPQNSQLLCNPCNTAKADRTHEEFVSWLVVVAGRLNLTTVVSSV